MPSSKFQKTIFPCRNPQRRFGADFFVSLFQGANPSRAFYASATDIDRTYRYEPAALKHMGLEAFTHELKKIPRGSVLGFDQNPDCYGMKEESQNMRKVLAAIQEAGMGLFMETGSENIVHDTDILVSIQEQAPLLIAVPIGFSNEAVGEKMDPSEPGFVSKIRLIRRLSQEKIKTGIIIKPIIPFVNDSEENLLKILAKAIEAGAVFVYPSFGIIVDDRQRPGFYELLENQFPGLRNIYMDTFGQKESLVSVNAAKLKKSFVFAAKKMHVDFGMKDIIKSYKPSSGTQMKLF